MRVKELVNMLKLLDQSKEIYMHEFCDAYFEVAIRVTNDEEMYFIENGVEIELDEEE